MKLQRRGMDELPFELTTRTSRWAHARGTPDTRLIATVLGDSTARICPVNPTDPNGVSDALRSSIRDLYSIERQLGADALQTTYLAIDRSLNRHVVLKALPPGLVEPCNLERFRAEIQAVATMKHPHIVPLLTASASSDALYCTMPFVSGTSLRHRLSAERRLSVAAAVRIADQVAQALDHAHQRGIIHRSLHPGNILLANGMALVADLGIAFAAARANGGTIDDESRFIGTEAYMSPEQASGNVAVDARADVFSLGCVLYEMLAGTPPYGHHGCRSPNRSQPNYQLQMLEARADVRRALARVVARALAPEPENRWSTIADFRRALASANASLRARRMGAKALISTMAAVALATFATRSMVSGHHDPELVAIAPFDVPTDDRRLAVRGEQVAGILSASLRSQGEWRAPYGWRYVDYSAAWRDAHVISDLARREGISTLVRGRVSRIGPDSVRLRLLLQDARRSVVVDDVTFDMPHRLLDAPQLPDSLATVLFGMLRRRHSDRALR